MEVGAAANACGGVEFFFQPVGSGPLKADYLIGEDVRDFGPIRSLSDPASI